MRLFLSCLLLLCVSSCTQHHNKKPEAISQKTTIAKTKFIPLNQLNPSFLFIAAQDALSTGDSVKAIRFLRVLVEKDPTAIQPRLQLTELLLHHNAAKEALSHIEKLLSMNLNHSQIDSLQQLQIRTLMLLQQHSEAIVKAKLFLTKKPKNLGIRSTLVRLYMETNQFPLAMNTVTRGLKLTNNPKLRLLEVRMFMVQKKYKKAKSSLRKLQKQQPKDPIVPILGSEIAELSQNNVQAEQILRNFIQKNSHSIAAHHALAKLLIRQKKLDEAISLYQTLQTKHGNNPAIATAIGLIYMQSEHFPQAEQQFKKSLKQQDNSSTRFYLAMALEGQQKIESAKKIYQQFSQQENFYAKAQLRLANLSFDQKRFTDSATTLLNLSQQRPMLSEPYYLLFNIRSIQKKYQQYIDESQAIIEKKKDLNLLFNRAIAFEKLKQQKKMELSLRAILQQDPNNTETLNFLAYSFAERGIRLDEAEALIKKALQKKPQDGYYLDSLAWVYYQQKEYAKALDKQQKAVKIINDDPVMLEHLGDILIQLKQDQEARKAWQKAIELKHEKPQEIQKKIKRSRD
ncbi:MAG: tetratricopeptide repeat protein [Mariprofundaceae bacterium]|nr:tetratricopeptide repeat protein [Mariprofundaceae bacterium]